MKIEVWAHRIDPRSQSIANLGLFLWRVEPEAPWPLFKGLKRKWKAIMSCCNLPTFHKFYSRICKFIPLFAKLDLIEGVIGCADVFGPQSAVGVLF